MNRGPVKTTAIEALDRLGDYLIIHVADRVVEAVLLDRREVYRWYRTGGSGLVAEVRRVSAGPHPGVGSDWFPVHYDSRPAPDRVEDYLRGAPCLR